MNGGEREILISSHLLPSNPPIFRHVIHQALRPATHLQSPNGPGGGGVSVLRKAVRAQSLRDGTFEQYKATVSELTPLIQRRSSDKGSE